jgi:hypothetical protein
MKGFASIVPPDADVAAVADAIARIVDAPFGQQPSAYISTPDGAEVVNMVPIQIDFFTATSRDLSNPLPPPRWRLEGVCEILCLVHDFTIAEFHNAYCVC